MTYSVQTLLERLCTHFLLIYDAWDEKHSDALAKKMLENDMIFLGLQLSRRDEFGQLAGYTLIAECVAYVRVFDSGIDQIRVMDYWTDIALEELQQHHFQKFTPRETAADILVQLRTISLARELFDLRRITKETAKLFSEDYIQFANMFFLRNGTISSDEMLLMRELEEKLITLYD
jgi:hypothetical protein